MSLSTVRCDPEQGLRKGKAVEISEAYPKQGFNERLDVLFNDRRMWMLTLASLMYCL